MIKLIKLLCIGSMMLVTAANAVDTAPANIATKLRTSLKQSLPELPVDQVNTSPVPGIYEIVSSRKVFYVDASGRYAMLGNLVDLNVKKSLTEEKVQSLMFVDWKKLPTNIAIVKIIGKGERKIAVFTDPDCPFCKQLDASILSKQQNLTIYYFLYPLAMHANAEEDSKRILCSEDPDLTYIDWMVNDKKLPLQNQCKRLANLTEMKRVGSQIVGVEATPTIVLPNGQIVSGLIPADYLSKLITDTSPALNPASANESQTKSVNTKSSTAPVTNSAPAKPITASSAK